MTILKAMIFLPLLLKKKGANAFAAPNYLNKCYSNFVLHLRIFNKLFRAFSGSDKFTLSLLLLREIYKYEPVPGGNGGVLSLHRGRRGRVTALKILIVQP